MICRNRFRARVIREFAKESGLIRSGEGNPPFSLTRTRSVLAPSLALCLLTRRFYLATDETDPTSLAYFRSRGAVLLSDLLTPADSALLSWPGNYNDVLSVVEQQVLARADYFVGSELSSTTGGAVNLRTRLGKPEWSWSVVLRGKTDLGGRQDNLRVRRRGAFGG